MQTITAVNLNTDGANPGGANTTDVVTATARQIWSNFPATAVAREGIGLGDLTDDQRKTAHAVLQVALSGAGAQQDADIPYPFTVPAALALVAAATAVARHHRAVTAQGATHEAVRETRRSSARGGWRRNPAPRTSLTVGRSQRDS